MKSATVLLAAALLAACTDGAYLTWEPETAAERELRESTERLQSTVGEGSLFGAAAGAVLGGLAGGAEGAFQGAQLGRLGGAAAGGYVRQLQAEFASQEAVLDQVLQDIARTNAELEVAIASMRALVAERQAAIAAAGPESEPRAVARGQRNAFEMENAVTAASQQAEFFGSARGLLLSEGSSTAVLDPQLALLAERIAAMRQIASSLSGTL